MSTDSLPVTAPIPPSDPPLLAVDDLAISYVTRHGQQSALHGVTFEVGRGQVVALVGESGSGKTTTAQAVIGLLADNGHRDRGRISLAGTELTSMSEKAMREVRGRRIGLVPQDPNNSLNPVRTIGDSLAEVLTIHRWGSKQAVRAKVLELLAKVGIDQPELRTGQYPHELSGGMKQRVLIASAIALEPDLVIADEPTSALDVTVQRLILDLIDDLRRETGAAVLLVTHDLGVAKERADRVVVMRGGHIVEQGSTDQVVGQPTHAYTRTLLHEAAAVAWTTPTEPPADLASRPVEIEVTDLVQEFSQGRGREPFRAVDGISLSVAKGSTHAIVGESGSGKTSTVRAILGFQQPTSGRIVVAGHEVTRLRGRRAVRDLRRSAQMVLQNPYSSLDPRQLVSEIIAEPLVNFGLGTRSTRASHVAEFLDKVALPHVLAQRLPRELSGGQRQRVAIARALILRPEVVVLDEPVSALDVTVQAQILRLLEELQGELDLTYLFISHDLGVVGQISDSVSVMRQGRIVEAGTTHHVFTDPQTEYTHELLAAIPGH